MKKTISYFLLFLFFSLITSNLESSNKTSVDPETALQWLKRGNLRYTKRNLRNDGDNQKDRNKLLSGQKPHSIILSCSDSRIPPEIIFDQKLGEIFVIRTAGSALDSTAIGSIEYAVEHLGTKLLVVLGHEECGAVKAAIKTLDGSSAGSPSLDKIVSDIHPRIKAMMTGKTDPSPMVAEEAKENAHCIVKDLETRSTIIKEKIKEGELRIVYALYHLKSGVVDFL